MAVYWNDTLDQEFIAMRRARTPVADMALHFGTTIGAIYAHARVIRCLVEPHNPMNDDERAELKAAALGGATDAEMAEQFSRTLGSIRWNLEQLGLVGNRAVRRSDEDYARLRHLVEIEGKTMPELEEVLGLSDTTIRKHLTVLGIKAARAARAVKPRVCPGKPGRPPRVIEPLNSNQIGMVGEMLGKASLRAIAAELRMSVETMKLRAAAAGLDITISMRRSGDELARDVLEALAAEGLTACQAGKRLGRDGRTVAVAAGALGIAFQTRASIATASHAALGAQRMAARVQQESQRLAARVGRERARADELAIAAAQRVAGRAVADAQRMAAHTTRAAERQAVKAGAASEAAARKLAAQQKAPAADTADQRMASKPVAGQPKVIRVMEAPAPAREAPVEPARPRRWNDGPLNGGKPKFVLLQSEVDAAVARFIAERGVTRPAAADPLEAAITAARRLGFIVLRDGDGFVLDHRIRLASGEELQQWVARRTGDRLPMSA